MLTARHIMTSKLVTIRPDATVEETINLLVEKQISGLPVTDDQGHLLGIVTEFALLAVAYDPKVRTDPVSEHMTKHVMSVGADDSMSKIADLCILHRIRRVPVLQDGKLVGLISRRDVLRAACTTSEPLCHLPPFQTQMAARISDRGPCGPVP